MSGAPRTLVVPPRVEIQKVESSLLTRNSAAGGLPRFGSEGREQAPTLATAISAAAVRRGVRRRNITANIRARAASPLARRSPLVLRHAPRSIELPARRAPRRAPRREPARA